jgi:hypothetical protein
MVVHEDFPLLVFYNEGSTRSAVVELDVEMDEKIIAYLLGCLSDN